MTLRHARCSVPALVAVLSLVLVATTAAHAGEAPAQLTFSVTPDEAPAGSEIVASGEACGAGTRLVEVAFTDLGSELATGEATADGTGAWEVTLRVPSETLQGDYGIVATCAGEEIYASTPFRVLSPGGNLDISDDGSSDNTPLLILGALGALLLIGGGVMVFVTQRRSRESP